MRAYLLITGSIFALLSASHLFIAFEHWRQAGAGGESVLAPALICIAGASLATWAFRLAFRAASSAN